MEAEKYEKENSGNICNNADGIISYDDRVFTEKHANKI